jgi:iron(III) transport system permease protein
VFVLAISEFGVPALLRVRVYTTEVFTAFAALFDFGRATILTLPLAAVAAGTSAAAALLLGGRVIAGRRPGAGRGLDVAAWRLPLHALMFATVSVAFVAPISVLLVEAGDLFGAARGAWPSIRVSLLLATLGATLVVGVGGVLGYTRARLPGRSGRAADVVWVVLFAVPESVCRLLRRRALAVPARYRAETYPRGPAARNGRRGASRAA